MTLIWLPEALDDVRRLYDFLFDKSPSAAGRAAKCVQQGAQTLRQHPPIGRRMDADTERRELFNAFGAGAYVLRYRIHQGSVVIIRVWHSRERRE